MASVARANRRAPWANCWCQRSRQRANSSKPFASAAGARSVAGLWFPKCAHVLDPLEVVRAFASAAMQRGATFLRHDVRALRATGHGMQVITDSGPLNVSKAIVCTGVWSAPLLQPFGLKVPLEAARGYHVQMPDATPLADAPILYSDANIVVTPMAGRIRATSFMEFAGVRRATRPAQARVVAVEAARARLCLRRSGARLGRPATGAAGLSTRHRSRGPAPNLLYAFGHQHIGLTLCAVTAQTMADLTAGREPAFDVSAFDLRRFGAGKFTF